MKRILTLLFIGVFISQVMDAQYPQYYGPQVTPYYTNYLSGNPYVPQPQVQFNQYLTTQQNFIQPQFCGGCRFQLVACRCRRNGLGIFFQQLFAPRQVWGNWGNFLQPMMPMPPQWQQPMPLYNNTWNWGPNPYQWQFQGNSFGFEIPYWRTY